MAGQLPTINEEAGLGPEWVPLDGPPIIPGQMVAAPPASDFSPTNPKYLQGSIAPNFQHDSSFVDTGDRTAHVPKFDLMPLGPQQNAITSTQVSSAVRSVVKSIQASAPATPADVESISTNIQAGTSYTASESDRNKLIVLNNNAGGTLTLPAVSIFTKTLVFDNDVDGSGTNPAAITTPTNTPTFTPSLALFLTSNQNPGSSPTPGAGWTDFDSINLAGSGAFVRVTNVPVSGSASTSATTFWASSLSTFSYKSGLPSPPTYVQRMTLGNGSLGAGGNQTFGSNVTKGNVILIIAPTSFLAGAASVLPTIVDSQGNSYRLLAHSQNPSPDPSNSNLFWQTVLMATTASATGSLNIAFSNFNVSGVIAAYEMSTVSLPVIGSVLSNGWFAFIENNGTGTFTVQSNANIDGSSQSISLPSKAGILVVSDGIQYWTFRGQSPGSRTPYQSVVLADTPTAYWRLGELSGHFTDSSGNGWNSTAESVTTRGQNGLIENSADLSAFLLGTNSNSVDASSSFPQFTIFTLEVWFRPTVIPTHGGLIGRNSTTAPGSLAAWYFKYSDAGDAKPTIIVVDSGGSNTTAKSPNVVELNQIYHLVATWDGTTASIYVNGQLANSVSSARTLIAQTGAISIGCDYFANAKADFGSGFYDEVAVYNYVLSAARILAHYQAGVAAL